MLLIDPNSEIIRSYDKRALWGWDIVNFTKGNSDGVYEIDGLKIGFKAKVELCFVSFSDVSESDLPKLQI